ncbi:MAG: hypothetical protein NC350_00175 [Corallococcus sp.]|nr:hypothetical protein [Corallococcus sp.]
MDWFNYIGLAIIVVIMVPNIVYAVKCKEGFSSVYKNKAAEVFEQIGRYGCFVLMIFNIPYTYLGFWFDGALYVYITVNACLCAAYVIIWAVFRNKTHLARAVTLSVLPSLVFLFSAIVLANIPLAVFAAVFAPCHILISCKNAQREI